ncbi:MAG: PEP-CTERM sorting domain-containing protein [Verrucomicrobiia bacterium]
MNRLSALLTLSAFAASSHAAVLVNWNFDGGSPGVAGTIVAVSSVASVADVASFGATGSRQSGGTLTNLSAGGDTGSGLSYIAPYEAGTAGPSPTPSFYGVSGFDTSPSSSSYVRFSLTMGTSIAPSVSQLEGIQFNLANSGTSGPRGVEVTYRIGTSGSFTSLGTTAVPNNTANNYGLFTFNLPSPITLSAGDVIEFRLLGYSNAAANSIRLDNVSITAIPEPSSVALLIGAGSLLFLLRRRWGKSARS